SKAILESDYSVACMIALINILLSLGLFMLYRLAAARTGVACMIALINILLSLGLFMLYRLAAARTGVRS
ncbi:hypothetical protein UA70_23280, partial [Raoultella planticola]